LILDVVEAVSAAECLKYCLLDSSAFAAVDQERMAVVAEVVVDLLLAMIMQMAVEVVVVAAVVVRYCIVLVAVADVEVVAAAEIVAAVVAYAFEPTAVAADDDTAVDDLAVEETVSVDSSEVVAVAFDTAAVAALIHFVAEWHFFDSSCDDIFLAAAVPDTVFVAARI